ncbi:hypothetical protein L1987_18994 [Smallanthus sonchifolius]|uniref:Uncharacterized protein n=1 Tax=Smallanthus sonchifolius TaxID=185202 RepID=A0ACB9J1R0_9ASTR|nr:hypothetical protein L1987_18994 [Smallanthus sonchifolius]
MALLTEIAQGFKEYKTAKSLWDALVERFEGNLDMRESRKDMLRYKFNMFKYVKGESLESQIIRFTHLMTEMSGAGIEMTKGEINKKLLNSLPINWNFNITTIKRTKDMYATSLKHLMPQGSALISSMSSAYTPNVPAVSSQTVSAAPIQQNHLPSSDTVKAVETNVALFSVFLNSYNALLAGKISPANLVQDDMEQIHPDDLEEMDIKWHMAMAVQRAKKFIKRTGRNSFDGMESGVKKIGFDKSNLRCYNCSKPGHFARECPETKVVKGSSSTSSQEKETAAPGESKALVSQQTGGYDWGDQIHELTMKVSNHALMAEIEDTEEITQLRYANAEHKRSENIFKDKIEASKNDFSKLEMDFSNKECLYHVQMEYGVGRKPDQPSSSIHSTPVIFGPSVQHVNATNPSKSCAETGLVEGIVEDCESGTLEKEEKQILNGKSFQFVQNKNRSYNRESSKPSTSQSNSKKLPQRFTKREFYDKFDNHHRAFEQNVRNGDRNCFNSNHRNYDRNDNQMFDRRFSWNCENAGYFTSSPQRSSSWDTGYYAPYPRRQTCYVCGNP